MFGQIETLVRKIDYSSMKAEHAVKKVASSGDPVKQASYNNAGAGTVNMAVNLENQKRFKRGSVNAFQNALSMMQAQTEALGQADKIYNRMRSLAQMASDPMMSSDDRTLLSEQFNQLREDVIKLNSSAINGKSLFDSRASSTKYSIDFGGNFTQDTDEDGTFKNSNGETWKYWEIDYDVLYNNGKMTIDVNSGGAADRYILHQGDLDNPLFDTGAWATEGWADYYDFDQFIVEYGPDQNTTFQFAPLSVGDRSNNTNSDSKFDNKLRYLQALTGTTTDDNGVEAPTADPWVSGKSYNVNDLVRVNKTWYKCINPTSGTTTPKNSSDWESYTHEDKRLDSYYDTSGWETKMGEKYTKLGQVYTNPSDPSSTRLFLRVESKTSFDIRAVWELPSLDSSVVARNDDLQVELERLGLGLMRDSKVKDFPLISIDTVENAQKAIVSMSKELDGLGEQFGRLASNFNQVNNAMSAKEELGYMSEKVLS